MKKITIFLLLTIISLFSFNTSVYAKDYSLNNSINMLEKYKFKKNIGVKPITSKAKKVKIKCDEVKFLHNYWLIIEIAGPILVILFGSMDFLLAVIASDEQKMKKARSKFPKRLIAAFLIFLAFTIVQIVIGMSDNASASGDSLIKCIVNGK